jgi:quercetin dioxygenase-like cupin family protein
MVVTVDLAALDLDEYPTRGGLLRVAFPFDSAVGTASTAAMLVELEPGGVLPTHADSAEEAILVLEGDAEVTVDGYSDRLSGGVVASCRRWPRTASGTTVRPTCAFSASFRAQVFSRRSRDR